MAHGTLLADNGYPTDDIGREPANPPMDMTLHSRRGRRGTKLAPWQLKRAQELMFQQMAGVLEVGQIAQELGMPTLYFTKLFKNTVGIPPYGWHLRQRIARSASLLHDQKMTLIEIAIECGFADQSHYTKAFRRLLGITPGKWRKSLQAGTLGAEKLIELN